MRASVSIPVRFFSACAILLLGACAMSGGSKSDIELAQFLQLLPGRYDNHAQALAQTSGQAVPDELLSIQRAYAPALGKYVFYVQQTAADESYRILAQRLVAIDKNEQGGIVQRDFAFADPPRWRMAAEQLDLFKGLIVDDVRGVVPATLKFDAAVLTMFSATRPPVLLRFERRP